LSRILVIDDSELVTAMLRENLAHEGYDVAVAHDANHGYSAAIEFQPDLILLDVQLPDVVGFDLIRILKNREDLSHIPIMMISGTAHKTEDKVRGFQLGADDYVLKPFDMVELLERIKALMRRSQSPAAVREGGGLRDRASQDVVNAADHGMSTQEYPALTMQEAVLRGLLHPDQIPGVAQLPALAMPYVMILLALILAGLGFSAGEVMKPAAAGFGVVLSWILLTLALVIATSVMGITCGWREGGRTLALAGVPILLKAAGACLFSSWTTLSPGYFTAGLPLIWSNAPFWAYRTDVFELWSILLLWELLRKRKGATPQKAGVAVVVVWIVLCALTAGVARLGVDQ
jgi:DNA-binding response OmpR family regulator